MKEPTGKQKRKTFFNPTRAARMINSKKQKLNNNFQSSSVEQSNLFQELQQYDKESQIKLHGEQSNDYFHVQNIDVQYVEDFNILEWWKSKQFIYTTLSNLARDLFCIPATSAYVERVFSISRRTITIKNEDET